MVRGIDEPMTPTAVFARLLAAIGELPPPTSGCSTRLADHNGGPRLTAHERAHRVVAAAA